MSTYIQCKQCGYHTKINFKFFANILGAAAAGFGYFAWVTFLFAGTGLAMPICIAIMAGGAAMLKYSDEIAAWLSQHYSCPECGAKNWKVVSEDQLKLEKLKNIAVTTETYNEVDVFPVMRKMYTDAEKFLYLSFPWYNIESVRDDFSMIKNALKRGVKIYVYYGIKPRPGKPEDRKRAQRTLEAINWLKNNLGEKNVFYYPVDCHIKYMACEKYTLQGSHNLFSYRPDHKDRGESMTKLTGKKAVNDAIEIIKSQPLLVQFEQFAYV